VRDVAVLFLHFAGDSRPAAGPGGARSVVAESVLVKHQLLILNRSRKRSPNLRTSDRVVAGLCALLMRPGRFIRSAIVFKPSTLLSLHRGLIQRKYRRLFSSKGSTKPGPQGTEPGRYRRRRRHETAESDVGVPTDRTTAQPGLRYSH
jgi:putative transposase